MPIIAVVDDNASFRAWIRCVLSALHGIEVHCYSNGLDLLKDAPFNPPALCLLDYSMPGLNGLELMRVLRQSALTAHVPVAIVTSRNDPQLLLRTLTEGAVDLLPKPMERWELQQRVLSLLHNARHPHLESPWEPVTPAEANQDVLYRCLGRIARAHDDATGRHATRMAYYAVAIGAQMNLSIAEQETLLLAAPLHDVGKIGVSLSLLQKPGTLSAAEEKEMRKHPRIGHSILAGLDVPVLDAAAEIALHHHERWDGSGYPDGLQGESIPLFARIVAVADVFDALTSDRPYKPTWSVTQAVQELHDKSGGHFDPSVVSAFDSALSTILQVQRHMSDTTSKAVPAFDQAAMG